MQGFDHLLLPSRLRTGGKMVAAARRRRCGTEIAVRRRGGMTTARQRRSCGTATARNRTAAARRRRGDSVTAPAEDGQKQMVK
ncbi:hypothetical protein LINPERPRIM_LOCUS31615 [Linum perenne]